MRWSALIAARASPRPGGRAQAPVNGPAGARMRVWSPAARIGVWALLAGFGVACVAKGEPARLRERARYVSAAAVAIRLVWRGVIWRGFVWGGVGPQGARLSYLATGLRRVPRSPAAMASDCGRRRLGEGPAGGALLFALALAALSGMATLGPWISGSGGVPTPLFALVAPVFDEGDAGRDDRGRGS